MDRVICDVCSMDYPATEAQCPICGCARSGVKQTSAGNTVTPEDGEYSPVKGGRFSKSNVRKRLKAAQIQPVPVEIPTRAEKIQEPEQEPDDNYDEDEEEEELDDDVANVSNRALIVIVALLLVAIVAVSSYIVLGVFGFNPFTGCTGCDVGCAPTVTTPVATTQPPQPTEVRIPCTTLTVSDTKITLVEKGGTMDLNYSVEPFDTTDLVSFDSEDPAVATVDSKGRVTAVGSGETNIIITCGDFTKTCKVVCVLGEDQPDEPTTPIVPDDPDEPVPELKLNRTDFTLNKKGTYHILYKGEIDPAEITWTSRNEKVVTVENGKVVAVGVGRTQVIAEYKGQTASCWVSCSWSETEPKPDTPDTPSTPSSAYFLKVDNRDPVYQYNNKDNSADVTINLNSNQLSFKLTIVNADGAVMNDVVWTMSKTGICSISGTTVKGLSEGTCILTAEYKGVTYTVFVRCNG